ncbi:undecaprenyldiphospho-muramoylpentapeptide beta-N-acetylglucosaminyltransferase [Sneathiella aquimaris]|uniref:undecaprenyldiphospho-muramoylpentapeptide beta-N-acetylglucosaminyltransferase n=1 Tax=Sneathiella aquimaris TaxID=2599305 RepID=UPI00146ED846|nr:undecaprenyldiphospho-muramoylpentapeptide beta-N-acetylglucosaminyltransferase [Sneathiella aquimaris]
MTEKRKHIVLASGGTGGHIFPARALAEELISRNMDVTLMTDQRGEKYEQLFPGVKIVPVTSASPSVGGVLGKLVAGFKLLLGTLQSIFILRKLKPDVVVGFGGYPSMPPAAAASFLGVPLILHEQNAVLGRVNRLLSGMAKKIATSFHHTESGAREIASKMSFTGNPVRQEIIALHGRGYAEPTVKDPIKLLILGGSQGATVLSDVVPAAIADLPDSLQSRLHVIQQCRPEDLARVEAAYQKTSVTTTLAAFFDNVPELLNDCHLAITRSGASTIAELTVSGRPAILVPYKFAMDNHQLKNAENEVAKGAARLILQDEFSVTSLKGHLEDLFSHPDKLTCMARASAQLGEINAAQKLADMVAKLNKSTKSGTSRSNGKVAA